jgi:hypothetical protein
MLNLFLSAYYLMLLLRESSEIAPRLFVFFEIEFLSLFVSPPYVSFALSIFRARVLYDMFSLSKFDLFV